MKKRVSILCMVLLLTLTLCVPTMALNGQMEYVIDSDDLLSYTEWEMLEEYAAEISQRHGCGVYIQFIFDYNEYQYGDMYDTAETFYYGYELGEGEDKEGILLLVSYDTMEYALYVFGKNAGRAFDESGLDNLEEVFLPYFAEEDWTSGFYVYLEGADSLLTYAEEHPASPVQITSEPVSPIRRVLTVVFISCVISLLICLSLKGKMKSVRRKSEAKNYTANGGLQLTEKYDRFTHTTESVRRIENNNSSDGGRSGSGRSGKI